MRYFIEVAYKGTAYSGFQTQKNANTIQSEIQKALKTLCKTEIELTGSSRTDKGVHAFQNFFHFDFEQKFPSKLVYNLNALLPGDIGIKTIKQVHNDAHCRFDAINREYKYFIYSEKNPFLKETAFYFPYRLDFDLMQEAANIIKQYTDFTSFSKKNTQVKTFECQILNSEWVKENGCLIYYVKGNRFLRGMVRALTSTMLTLGRGKIDLNYFRKIIEAKDCTLANFAVPAHGLFLIKVNYPDDYFK